MLRTPAASMLYAPTTVAPTGDDLCRLIPARFLAA